MWSVVIKKIHEDKQTSHRIIVTSEFSKPRVSFTNCLIIKFCISPSALKYTSLKWGVKEKLSGVSIEPLKREHIMFMLCGDELLRGDDVLCGSETRRWLGLELHIPSYIYKMINLSLPSGRSLRHTYHIHLCRSNT